MASKYKPGDKKPNGRLFRADRDGAFAAQFKANRKIILATQSICAICGQPVDKMLKSPHPMSATVDHIIPVSKRGHPSDLSNLQLAHRQCNRAKSDRLAPDDFGKPEKTRGAKPFPQSLDWRSA